MKPTEKSQFGYYFLILILIIYLILSYFNINKFLDSLIYFKTIFIQTIPVLFFVYILLVISDLYLNEKRVKKTISKFSGYKGWLISIIGGIISSGPIYMWYPFLSNLKNKGVKSGFIVAFLYNRAIKFPQIPIMLIVYDIYFITILFSVMIISSIIQGIIVNYFEKENLN